MVGFARTPEQLSCERSENENKDALGAGNAASPRASPLRLDGVVGIGRVDEGHASIVELATLLAWLDDGDRITISFTKAAFDRAHAMADGGPEILSTAQAARRYGWTAKWWRGKVDEMSGALRDEQGHWRLPKTECRRIVAEMQTRGVQPPRLRGAAGKAGRATGGQQRGSRVAVQPSTKVERSVRRGPRVS